MALDKLDKIGRDGVLQDMTARQIDEAAANRLLELFTGSHGRTRQRNDATLDRLAAFVGDHPVGRRRRSSDLRTILA